LENGYFKTDISMAVISFFSKDFLMVSHNPMTNLPLQMDHEEVRDFLKKKAESPGDLDQT